MKLCLFSISYAGLWEQQQLDVESFIAHAAELGYEAVMLAGKRPHLSPLDATDERLGAIRNLLKKHRVQCPVIAAYTDLSGQGAAEVPQLELQVAYVESLARMAARLGAGIVRVFTAYESEREGIGATWQRVVGGLREMCDRAAGFGVTIAVQNHMWWMKENVRHG